MAECLEKFCSWYFKPPIKRQRPIMPFKMSIVAEYTVSLASATASSPPEIMSDMMIDTSMIVMAMARIMVP
ncbi:hypothetical protein D3C85_1720960 [compost metagenome]